MPQNDVSAHRCSGRRARFANRGLQRGSSGIGMGGGEERSPRAWAAQGALERLPNLHPRLFELNVDVIAVIGAVTVRAARQATTNIPIVFAIVVEPIGDHMAPDLERPSGNVTGVTTFDPGQARTHLQFLKAVKPDLERLAILSDLGVSECMSNSNRQAALDLGLKPQVIRVKGPSPDYLQSFSNHAVRWSAGAHRLRSRLTSPAGKKLPTSLSRVDCLQYLRESRPRPAGLSLMVLAYAKQPAK